MCFVVYNYNNKNTDKTRKKNLHYFTRINIHLCNVVAKCK